MGEYPKQNPLRECIKRMLRKKLPDYTFDEYPVMMLRPHQRELDLGMPLPAWSITARHKDGHLVEVYCQHIMSHISRYGLAVYGGEYDASIEVGEMTEALEMELEMKGASQ